MKAQAALEYLIMAGISLTIVSFIWVYVTSSTAQTEWTMKTAYARQAANKIAQSADIVYTQGYPAEVSFLAVFPDNIDSVSIANRTIIIQMRSGYMLTTIIASTLAEITGNISIYQGSHRISVKSENGYVNITEEFQ